MTSLMEEVEGKQTGNRSKGGGCSVEAFLSEQGSWPVPKGRDRRYTNAEWLTVFQSHAEHRAIWKVMREYGYTRGENAVQRHRKGNCACPKD